MENANGATLRDSHRAVFDVLRPVIRVLRASGFAEDVIRSAAERACRRYTDSPSRGVWLDHIRFTELAGAVVAWTRDPDFLNEAGLPRKLDLDGGSRSFRGLLRKSGCSMAPRQALEALQALGSVQSCSRGHQVRLVSSVVIGVMGKRFVVAPMINSLRRLAETLEHNLCERPAQGEDRMHRWALCTALDPAQFREAQRFARSTGQTFIEVMDEKLSTCVKKPRAKPRRGVTYGVGLYVFVDEPKRRRRPAPKRRKA
jgi:hypothetical protein